MNTSDSPEQALSELKQAGLLRQLRPLVPGAGARIQLPDGRNVINFASNDYLGLAQHPLLVEAAHHALDEYGVGSGASRLVTGTHPLHEELEAKVADIKHTEQALTFTAGYTVSVGVIPALMTPADTIILDKLSHASLIDGARLSGATIRVFPHNNVERLEHILKQVRAKSPASARILVVTESIFSMDGDRAPLREICEIKDQYGALLLVDEAHSFGLVGSRGAGLAAELSVSGQIDFQMGTFSKAVGASGGYVATSRPWKEWLLNSARSFIYTTSPPPLIAAAISASLDLISGEEGDRRRAHLAELALHMNRLLGLDERPTSSIFPKIIGENEDALAASSRLLEEGLLAPAIRYPTVPRGTARLRLTITAAHSHDDLVKLGNLL